MSLPQQQKSPGRYPTPGLVVSVEGKGRAPLSATVTKGTEQELWLQLSRPLSEPLFEPRQETLIKYWDEGSVAFYWKARVIKMSGLQNEHLVLSIEGEGMTVQRRRSYRVRVALPFSFTVVDAAASELNGRRLENLRTRNISVGGVAFESELPLKPGDRLEMSIELPSSRRVSAIGWVVRQDPPGSLGRQLIAVEFLQLQEEEQYQLMRFLVRFRPRSQS